MHQVLFGLICSFAAVFSTLLYGGEAIQPEVFKAAVDSDGVQRIRIVGGSYFFKPNHIIVKARTPVELIVTREQGVAPHSLVIQAPQAGIAVDEALSTDPKTLTFMATAPGKYVFYCKNKLLFLPSHREKGMAGILEVVE